MPLVLYVLFGAMDIIALFALMFKAYKFPFREYLKEIAILATSVACVSYLLRVYFELNQLIDIISNLLIYIIFMWIVIRIKLWRATIMSLFYFIYGLVNFTCYFIYVSSGFLPISAINNPSSMSVYLIQATTQIICFVVASLLYYFGWGFNWFPHPPHDLILKRKIERKYIFIIGLVFIAAAAGFFSFFYLSHYLSLIIIPFYLTLIVLILWLAYRRECKND